MRYELTKKLSNRQFKRLVGVQRHTFEEMVKVQNSLETEEANLVLNTQAVTTSQNKAGRFILATNLTDIELWTPTDILQEYKKQSVSERGFKFLKDPIFRF